VIPGEYHTPSVPHGSGTNEVFSGSNGGGFGWARRRRTASLNMARRFRNLAASAGSRRLGFRRSGPRRVGRLARFAGPRGRLSRLPIYPEDASEEEAEEEQAAEEQAAEQVAEEQAAEEQAAEQQAEEQAEEQAAEEQAAEEQAGEGESAFPPEEQSEPVQQPAEGEDESAFPPEEQPVAAAAAAAGPEEEPLVEAPEEEETFPNEYHQVEGAGRADWGLGPGQVLMGSGGGGRDASSTRMTLKAFDSLYPP
jgi:hypothetical protein